MIQTITKCAGFHGRYLQPVRRLMDDCVCAGIETKEEAFRAPHRMETEFLAE